MAKRAMQAAQAPDTDCLDMKSLLSGLIDDSNHQEVAMQKEYKRKLDIKFKKYYVQSDPK
jgi:hypothetical protein